MIYHVKRTSRQSEYTSNFSGDILDILWRKEKFKSEKTKS